jgi:OOP family OmpA-OmpF porin
MGNTELSPFPAFHFAVEINGVAYPFKSVSGLKIETSVVELEEGGFNATTRKLIGRTKFPNIVLKKGVLSGDSDLYKLKLRNMKDTAASASSSTTSAWVTPDRFSGTVTQMGPEGSNIKWFFSGAFISKWEGPDFDATKNEISVESIEISHNGLVMLDAAGPGSADPAPAQQPAPSQTNNATINFGSGSADPGGGAATQKVADDLKKNPDKKVNVEGHTDNVGGAAMNLKLSQQRADSVRQQLISQGAKPEQVTATGYGEDRPIADNSTSSGRAQNRRVEIHDA